LPKQLLGPILAEVWVKKAPPNMGYSTYFATAEANNFKFGKNIVKTTT